MVVGPARPGSRTDIVTLRFEHGIALLCIDHPPVNALSTVVTSALAAALDEFARHPQARALVIYAAGRTFVAGGDIGEFDDPAFSVQPFNRTLARIEQLDRPVVAALHGTVLGGGLELALACHYRVAQPGTRFGFPEVKLGLLPGSLGTQRLPRVAGVEKALDLILGGNLLSAQEALEAGIVDEVQAGEPAQIGIDYANALLARQAGPRRASERPVASSHLPRDFFEQRRQSIGARGGAYPALERIVRCVEAAATAPFAEGEALEAELFEACRRSSQSKAMRHLFFAEREAARIPGVGERQDLRAIARVGVVGAGTMGSGIAMTFANAGIPVALVEASPQNLARGLDRIGKSYEASAAKGRLSVAEAAKRTQLIEGTLALEDLAACDLVIEAVYEDLALKRTLCARLGEVCRPGAIIASNTSTLDVNLLAQASGRPADVLGLHFFSPANVMRLLEVVRGDETAPDVLATAIHLAKRIGKVPVVSGVCYGFIGNRMIDRYLRETEFLLMEGATPASIDGALEALGLAMGPCRMLDMAGIDVGAKVVLERAKAGTLPPDPAYRAVVRRMFELGRLGQKTALGFYRYDGRKALEDPAVEAICQALAREHRIPRRSDIAPQEIVERCLYPLINEGTLILEEGIAYRPGDIDVVYTCGYGFPDFRGGPMWMADEIGLARIVERMDDYARRNGNAFGYWTVSGLLREYAANGRRMSDWRRTQSPRDPS